MLSGNKVVLLLVVICLQPLVSCSTETKPSTFSLSKRLGAAGSSLVSLGAGLFTVRTMHKQAEHLKRSSEAGAIKSFLANGYLYTGAKKTNTLYAPLNDQLKIHDQAAATLNQELHAAGMHFRKTFRNDGDERASTDLARKLGAYIKTPEASFDQKSEFKKYQDKELQKLQEQFQEIEPLLAPFDQQQQAYARSIKKSGSLCILAGSVAAWSSGLVNKCPSKAVIATWCKGIVNQGAKSLNTSYKMFTLRSNNGVSK